MQCKGILLTSFKIVDSYSQVFHIFFVNIHRYYNKSRSRNPYDVLGVKSTCTTQEVRKAYIKLCKELHPDMKPNDASQHKKFVELNNAYTALMSAESRKHFNNKTNRTSHKEYDWNHKWTYKPFDKDTRDKEKPWYEQEEYQKFYRQSYNPSNNRQPSSFKWTLFGCLVLVIVGSILTYLAYRYAIHYTLNIVDKKSKKISENYKDVRKNALSNCNEEKTEELKKRWNL